MEEKSGRLVAQQSNCNAANVYNSIFGFSSNVWVKDKGILRIWFTADLETQARNGSEVMLTFHNILYTKWTHLFAASTRIWRSKWGTCFFFFFFSPNVLLNQRLGDLFFVFLLTTSSKTFFLNATSLYCITVPGENVEKTLTAA